MAPGSAKTAASPRWLSGLQALCGPRRIPEGEVCIPLPDLGTELAESEPLEPTPAAHPALEPGRGLEIYDQIPRRPDRPADPARYIYPIGTPDQPPRIVSGYDLDLPGDAQRRTHQAVGHGGIDVAASRGDEVHVASLENQEGEAEIAFVGELFGTTVVTAHQIRESGRLRTYVVLYGHLERPRLGLIRSLRLASGDLVGFAGDSGSPGLVHLHLEIRQLRDGVSLDAIDLSRLVNNAVSIPTDPRNILPVRGEAEPPGH
jgi:murein DD-endopeptidase MepM/ murein hydrolase activator NlpD